MRYKFTTRFFIAFFSIASAHSQINTAADITKQLNPAMEGLTHKVTSNMLISGAKAQFIKTSEFSADYSRFFAKRNIGAGIHVYNLNYNQRDNYASNTEGIKLNLNKQFVLKNKLTFSTGVGLGFLSQGRNWNFTDPNYMVNRETTPFNLKRDLH